MVVTNVITVVKRWLKLDWMVFYFFFQMKDNIIVGSNFDNTKTKTKRKQLVTSKTILITKKTNYNTDISKQLTFQKQNKKTKNQKKNKKPKKQKTKKPKTKKQKTKKKQVLQNPNVLSAFNSWMDESSSPPLKETIRETMKKMNERCTMVDRFRERKRTIVFKDGGNGPPKVEKYKKPIQLDSIKVFFCFLFFVFFFVFFCFLFFVFCFLFFVFCFLFFVFCFCFI